MKNITFFVFAQARVFQLIGQRVQWYQKTSRLRKGDKNEPKISPFSIQTYTQVLTFICKLKLPNINWLKYRLFPKTRINYQTNETDR